MRVATFTLDDLRKAWDASMRGVRFYCAVGASRDSYSFMALTDALAKAAAKRKRPTRRAAKRGSGRDGG